MRRNLHTKKKNALLNPKREPLSPGKLRELSGLNLSDEQAEEVIGSLTKYARIIFEITLQQEKANKCQNESEASVSSPESRPLGLEKNL